jgi:hypothetical protein
MSEERGSASSRTYGGWQLEKVAFLFGLSGKRAIMLTAAVLAAIMPIAMVDITAAVILWPLAVLLTAAAFIRIAGRTADEWLTAAVSYQLLAFRSQHKFASGPFAPRKAHEEGEEPLADLPGILAPVKILAVPSGSGGRELAVAHHRRDRTYTAVAKVSFPGIGLADSVRRDQRVAGWGSLIAGLCTEGNPVTRVQALQRIVPESGAALRRWHGDHLTPDASAAALGITDILLATTTLATARRESYLAFTMDERRAHAVAKAAGGGQSGAVTVLLRHLKALSGAISGADLIIEDWLGPRDLAEVIRTAYDPDAQAQLDIRRAAAQAHAHKGEPAEGLPPGVPPALAGPAYAEARPGVYLHDGTASVTYWVHEWPRSQAYCTGAVCAAAQGALRLSPQGGRVLAGRIPRWASIIDYDRGMSLAST